jgi:tetratricopeptide (TPR) repeat protein
MATSAFAFGQYNCEAFKATGDTCKYEACKYIENAPKHFQLLKEYHDIYNKALEICPDYHPAYKSKSIAYLKTGDFIMWKKLIDKAVEMSPLDHLDYRGWCRFQFFRDYKGAIADIERLQKSVGIDAGFGQNGMYHLNIARALCYKMLGEKDKAIEIIEKHLNVDNSDTGLYVNYHLGILYYEKGAFEKALSTFNKQTQEHSFAENEYYKSLVYKALNKTQEQKQALEKSLKLYQEEVFMRDVYSHQVDKIYFLQVKEEYDQVVGE